MGKTIKVDKIRLELGGHTLELSIEQMKELRDLLNETFPNKETVYFPTAPVVIRKPVWPYQFRYWEPSWYGGDVRTLQVTCKTGTATSDEG